MSNKVIIHTASRVIRRLTTDDVPSIATDETAVDIGATPMDVGRVSDGLGGWLYWKLDLSNNKVQASAAEVTQAEVDPDEQAAKARQIVQEYKQVTQTFLANIIAANQTQVKQLLSDFVTALTNLLRAKI